MIQLPTFELKEERQTLVKLMCAPFKRHPDYQLTKAGFMHFVSRMDNRNVLDAWLL